MGNTISSGDENKSKLADKIDDIASKYILSQTFDDMNKMSEKGYCDKMVILTSKIIDNNLTPLEQKEVAERMYPSKNVNENTNTKMPQPEVPQPEVQKQLGGDNNDSNNDSNNKEKDCIKIAKFYVKVAHIFAAIMKTINPVIISVNKEGKKQKYDLMSKQNMPTDEEILTIEHNNFCTKRINSLLQESDYDRSNLNNISLSLKPRFCNINYDKNSKSTRKFYNSSNNTNNNNNSSEGLNNLYKGGDYNNMRNMEGERGDFNDRERGDFRNRERDDFGNRERDDFKDRERDDPYKFDNKQMNKQENSIFDKNKNEDQPQNEEQIQNKNKYRETEKEEIPLTDNGSEIGIPELLKLYYDEYNEEEGDYTGISKEMKAVYANDLNIFYKAFTGKDIPIDEDGNKTITKYEQIPLMDFHNNEKCKGDGLFTENYDGTLKDKLFREYALHIKKMTNSMNTSQDSLLKILDKLFTFKKSKKRKNAEEEASTNEENEEEEETSTKQEEESTKQEEESTNNLKNIMNISANNELKEVNNAPQEPQVGGIKDVDDVTVRLNPELDDGLLKSLINSTRQLIVEMYITCETDFLKGITLFEGIVAAQLANTTTSKIRLLNDLTVGYLHNHQQG